MVAVEIPNEIQHPKKRAFLVAYAKSANITAACKAAKIDRSTYYAWAEHDEPFVVAANLARSEAGDLLEEHARQWATIGVKTVKEIYELGKDGTLALVKREHSREISPTLLIFLLKGAKPEKYRERFDVNHSGSVVKAMDSAAWESV